jgi:hypothetical protein
MTPTPHIQTTRMHRTTIILVAVAPAAATIAVAPIADAQQPATTPAKILGSYLYIQKVLTAGQHRSVYQPYATLVFRTDRQLPRRYDGLIRAGARVAHQGGSLGSVHGRASRCYAMFVRIKKDNTITGTISGSIVHIKARPGSKLPIQITTADDAPTIRRTLTLRKPKAGDVSGKPLGC